MPRVYKYESLFLEQKHRAERAEAELRKLRDGGLTFEAWAIRCGETVYATNPLDLFEEELGDLDPDEENVRVRVTVEVIEP